MKLGCWFSIMAAVIVAVTVDNVEACSTAGIGMYCKAYRCNAFAIVPASVAASSAYTIMCMLGWVASGFVRFINSIGSVRTAPKLFVNAVRVHGLIFVP